jgi:hypothetical protein
VWYQESICPLRVKSFALHSNLTPLLEVIRTKPWVEIR